jgi:hypothetical protein
MRNKLLNQNGTDPINIHCVTPNPVFNSPFNLSLATVLIRAAKSDFAACALKGCVTDWAMRRIN